MKNKKIIELKGFLKMKKKTLLTFKQATKIRKNLSN